VRRVLDRPPGSSRRAGWLSPDLHRTCAVAIPLVENVGLPSLRPIARTWI
jgi:hypothetical protein